MSSRFDPLRHSGGVRGGVAKLRWEPELELDAGSPRTQVELAIACDCEPPTLTQLAQKLEAAGLDETSPATLHAVMADLARSLSTGGGPRRLPPKSRSSQG